MNPIGGSGCVKNADTIANSYTALRLDLYFWIGLIELSFKYYKFLINIIKNL